MPREAAALRLPAWVQGRSVRRKERQERSCDGPPVTAVGPEASAEVRSGH